MPWQFLDEAKRICITRDCIIEIRGKVIALIPKEHPNCEVLCDILKEAKKILLSCPPHRRGIEFGYILLNISYYEEQGIITENERRFLTDVVQRMMDYL